MKSLTVRLPDQLVLEIEAESRARNRPKSDVVRERLQKGSGGRDPSGGLSIISDLIGAVDGLPPDISERTKAYLRTEDYGGKRNR